MNVNKDGFKNRQLHIEVLSRTIKDGRVISLIHKYLNAGVISRGNSICRSGQ